MVSSGKASSSVANAAIASSTQTVIQVATINGSASAATLQQVAAAIPGAISYSNTTLALPIGQQMTTLVPTSTGTFSFCDVSPALPKGLSLSAACALSGTPTVASASVVYTITPRGGTGAAVTISVVNNLPNLSYPSSPVALVATTAGGTVIPTNTGGPITSCAVSPALISGMTLTSSCAIVGAPDINALIGNSGGGSSSANGGGTSNGGSTNTVNGNGTGNGNGNSSNIVPDCGAYPNTNSTSDNGITMTYNVTPSNSSGAGTPASITFNFHAPPAIYGFNNAFVPPQTSGLYICPAVAAGTLTNCQVSPALPSVFTLANNCQIAINSHTPLVTPATYVITAVGANNVPALSVMTLGVVAPTPNFYFTPNNVSLAPSSTVVTTSPTLLINSGAITSCTVSPALPLGFTVNGDCSFTGATLTAQSSSFYTFTGTNSSGSYSASLNLAIAVPITLYAFAEDRWINLNWPIVSGASGYVLVAHYNGPVMNTLSNGSTYYAGQTLPGNDVVLYVGNATGTTFAHERLAPGDAFSYALFPFASGSYLGEGVNSATAIQYFTGLEDTYLVSPYLNGMRFYNIAWQPFDNGLYNQFNYTFDLSTGSSPGSLSLTSTSSSFDQYGVMQYQDPSNNEVFTNIRSRNPMNQSDGNNFTFDLKAGGSRQKIYGRNRFNGENPSFASFSPLATAVDYHGNVIFSTTNGTINVLCNESLHASYCRDRTMGQVYTIIGADGPTASFLSASFASLAQIKQLTVDSFDNIYMVDNTNNGVLVQCNRNSPSTGFCAGKTIGAVFQPYSFPGPAGGIAVDSLGNVILTLPSLGGVYAFCFVTANSPICGGETLNANNTIAGAATPTDSVSGPPVGSTTGASLAGITTDPYDNVYFADATYNRIRVICYNTSVPVGHVCNGKTLGYMYRFAGDGTTTDGTTNSSAAATAIGQPGFLAADSLSNIYLTDNTNYHVRVVCQSSMAPGFCNTATVGNVVTVAFQSGSDAFTPTTPATSAGVATLSGLGVDASGNLVTSDSVNNRVRAVCNNTNSPMCSGSGGGNVAISIAGGAQSLATTPFNYPAINAPVLSPLVNTAVNSFHDLYVADPGAHQIFVVCNTTTNSSDLPCYGNFPGRRYPVAGLGYATSAPTNGTSFTAASMNNPLAMTFDNYGNLFVAGGSDGFVYALCFNAAGGFCSDATAGTITRIAGNGSNSAPTSNAVAASSPIGVPSGIKADTNGNLFVTDNSNHLVYMLCNVSTSPCTATGHVVRLTGTTSIGDGSDNSTATSSATGTISQLATDSAGNLYLADQTYHRVRLVCLTTVAGCSSHTAGQTYRLAGIGSDGTPMNSSLGALYLGSPSGVVVDQHDNVIVATAGVAPRLVALCLTGYIGSCSTTSSGQGVVLAGMGSSGNSPSNQLYTNINLSTSPGNDFNRLTVDGSNIYMSEGAGNDVAIFLGISN